MSALEGNGGSIPFRVATNEKRLDRIEEWRSRVDAKGATQSEQIRQFHEDVADLRREVRGLRRTMMTLSTSIAVSAVVFALSILSATGKL